MREWGVTPLEAAELQRAMLKAVRGPIVALGELHWRVVKGKGKQQAIIEDGKSLLASAREARALHDEQDRKPV